MNKPAAPVLEMDEKAFARGFVSGNMGRPEDCPYPSESRQAWAWSAGRIEGQAIPKGTLPQLRPTRKPKP